MEGEPIDELTSVPPEKLKGHRALTRLWIGTLLRAAMRRKTIPVERTQFVQVEAAQLGTFEPLLTAATLLRGYGLQLVTVRHDPARMKTRYRQDWATMLNNSAALLAFGSGHFSAAKEYGDVLGIEPGELASLKPDEAALAVREERTRKIARLSYHKDEQFTRQADPDPCFERERGA